MNKNHPFYLVDFSPWPILGALSAMSLLMGMMKWFHLFKLNLFMLSFLITILVMFQWWRDIMRESTFQGNHTFQVSKGLRWGMILFITSEIFFFLSFLSFFWSFFSSSLDPSTEIGMLWPPKNIIPFNPNQIPSLNTVILLSSGLTVTWAHHSIMENIFYESWISFSLTIFLGLYFSLLQEIEYMDASFSIADSVYGSCFFMATGFHGIHVLIGTTFLLICLMRLLFFHFSSSHHLVFEMAAWCWHFVDVVWLFLYLSIYWWES